MGSGGAMVLGKLPVPGRPTIWMIVGQGPTALPVIGHFYPPLSFLSSFLSPSLWETARYSLKYCLRGPLNLKNNNNNNINSGYLKLLVSEDFLTRKFTLRYQNLR